MKYVLTLYVCLAMAMGAVSAQSPAGFQKPAAPGQLVDVGGGRRLHVICKGSGDGPTVIFEAGLSQYTAASTYGKAQDAIASFARVCVYDRAGLGWSDAIPDGRTHRGMVEDLHALLAALKIPPPYVLVGHSMGGLLVRQYAQVYRGEVAGVVLVDATSETIYEPSGAQFRTGVVAQIAQGLAKARPGAPVVPLPDGTSPDIVMSFMPEVLAAVKDEYQAIDRTPAELRGPNGYGTLARSSAGGPAPRPNGRASERNRPRVARRTGTAARALDKQRAARRRTQRACHSIRRAGGCRRCRTARADGVRGERPGEVGRGGRRLLCKLPGWWERRESWLHFDRAEPAPARRRHPAGGARLECALRWSGHAARPTATPPGWKTWTRSRASSRPANSTSRSSTLVRDSTRRSTRSGATFLAAQTRTSSSR